MKLLMRIFTLLLGLCWGSQSLAVMLSGVVTDEVDGLDEVEVLLIEAANGVVINRYFTDSTGAYHFNIKPGAYKLGAIKEEYPTRWRKGVLVEASDVEVNIEMRLGVTDEEDDGEDCD
ncbi:MAG: carboxypeptidase-like regulatory domain-containing protein [Sedimenticola sp.]